MARHLWPSFALLASALTLSGCGVFERPQRPAWRGQAENICLAQKHVRPSSYLVPFGAMNGPGICGLDHPFKVTALAQGSVVLNATQTLGCPMIDALDTWVREVVQPLAQQRFGEPIVKINSMGAYSCRSIDNLRSTKLSEHAFGNAVDIGGFELASGRVITVVKGWTRGDEQEKAFLREAQAGACNIFTTVLAPGSDTFHYNHIHLDLAMHGATSTGPRRYCKPRPTPQLTPAPGVRDNLPDAPDLDEELDVAQAGRATVVAASRPAYAVGALDLGSPAPLPRPLPRPTISAFAAPMDLRPPAAIGSRLPVSNPAGPAHFRSDGAFVPADMSADADVTSTIKRRTR